MLGRIFALSTSPRKELTFDCLGKKWGECVIAYISKYLFSVTTRNKDDLWYFMPCLQEGPFDLILLSTLESREAAKPLWEKELVL